jgi:hypothetical protein
MSKISKSAYDEMMELLDKPFSSEDFDTGFRLSPEKRTGSDLTIEWIRKSLKKTFWDPSFKLKSEKKGGAPPGNSRLPR